MVSVKQATSSSDSARSQNVVEKEDASGLVNVNVAGIARLRVDPTLIWPLAGILRLAFCSTIGQKLVPAQAINACSSIFPCTFGKIEKIVLRRVLDREPRLECLEDATMQVRGRVLFCGGIAALAGPHAAVSTP